MDDLKPEVSSRPVPPPARLRPPPPPPRFVPRERLQALLEGATAPLTLVVGPAGWGKTTTLAEWARARSEAVGWVSLDGSDDDPIRFLGALTSALSAVDPALGRFTRSLLAAPLPNVATIRRALVAELAARPAPISLVVDDYHLLADPGVHETVASLVEGAESGLRLLLGSRELPPLPLARWRLAGRLRELGPDQLRFTPSEVGRFLEASAAGAAGEEEVRALWERTEGWPAGIQLLELSAAVLAPGAAPVFDYFADEVFTGLDPATQEFLLSTAFLDRLTPSLCHALTGRDDAGVVLQRLERANLFTVRLDGVGTWYRYHALFADFLQQRSTRLRPELSATLRQHAARWFLAHDRSGDALEQLLAGETYEQAAEVLEESAGEFLLRGERATVWRWLAAFPESVRRERPLLGLWGAWVLEGAKPDARGDDWLPSPDRAAEVAAGAWGPAATTLAALLAGWRALREDDLGGLCQRVREAQRHRPEQDVFLRLMVASELQAAFRFTGDRELGDLAIAEFQALGRLQHRPADSLRGWAMVGQVQMMQGRYREAERTFRGTLRKAEQWADRDVAVGEALAHQFLGYVLLEWNRLPEAEGHLQRAIQLALPSEHLGILSGSFRVLAEVQQARGQSAAAQATFARLEALDIQHTAWARDYIAAARADLELARGNVGAARCWLAGRKAKPPEILAADARELHRHVLEYTVLARVLLAVGENGTAVQLLEALHRVAAEGARRWFVANAAALLAVAHLAAGRVEAARQSLAEALRIGQTEGFVRLFVDAGSPLVPLIEDARDIAPAYRRQLLKELAANGESATLPQLTERERSVLGLIADGMSNKAIAQALGISLSTTKTHLQHAYRKLGANSRTAAMARARELGLL